MGGTLKSRPYLRFALGSAATIGVMAALFAYIAAALVQRWEEHSVARQMEAAVAQPLLAHLDGGSPPTNADLIELQRLATAAVEGDITFVRVQASDGRLVYASGDVPAEAVAVDADMTYGRVDGLEGALFVTATRADGYVVEVGQDAGGIDGAIRVRQFQIAALTMLFATGGWVILQVAFTAAIATLVRSFFRTKYLYDTGEQLRSSLDLHDVLSKLATDATSLVRGRYGLVALMDNETNELMLKTTYDHASGAITLHQRPLDEWFIRRCVATNETVVSPQAAATYKSVLGLDAQIDGNAALLCVPMSLRDRVLGAIAVIRPADLSNYTNAETHLIEELAGQAVTAIEQAQLFAKVRADANELESSYDTTLKVLMAALDAKDNDTEGHCERVARLTVQLARSMGVPESSLVDIERGALLHDVGKIGVPDAVLKQPNKLNQLEWEAMRKHPLLAGVMVSKVGFLEKALPILLYHHERYDGKGYPFGLSGEHIPLEARIFSVIDAYDAMTSDRPYRAAMSHDDAMAEIEANRGSQFDPFVVDAFARLMESRPELREKVGHRMDEPHDEDLDPSRSAA